MYNRSKPIYEVIPLPAAYAHLRFGNESIPRLPKEARLLAKHFSQLYEVGLQGPDLFFFYNPVLRSETGQLGYRFHRQSGREFFGNAAEKLRRSPSDGAKAYLYGVLGHYCLDSLCHPFVHATAETGEAGHMEMETDFDRALMKLDGIDKPHLHALSAHFRLTAGECATAALFYAPASARDIRKCVRDMALVGRLTATKHRKLAGTLLSFGGKNGREMLMTERPNPRCRRTTAELTELYHQAMEKYPRLCEQLSRAISAGEPLGDDFEACFG